MNLQTICPKQESASRPDHFGSYVPNFPYKRLFPGYEPDLFTAAPGLSLKKLLTVIKKSNNDTYYIHLPTASSDNTSRKYYLFFIATERDLYPWL
jgi:hypothetical protein